IANLVAKVAKGYAPEFTEARVRLQFENKVKDTKFYGDSARLEQVLHNLIKNALQACTEGDNVTIQITSSGFVIKDSGEGMA
ncbi:ATP-binding protein, partial [Acinetobacter baumannii]